MYVTSVIKTRQHKATTPEESSSELSQVGRESTTHCTLYVQMLYQLSYSTEAAQLGRSNLGYTEVQRYLSPDRQSICMYMYV